MATLPGLRVSLTLDSATFIAETRRVNASVNRLGTSFDSVKRSVDVLRAGFAALGAGMVLRSIVQATTQFERINSALRVGTGSAEGAARAYSFVREEAARLGLDLGTTAEQFSKLAAAARGTALEGEGAREIFTAVAEASAALRLSTDQTGGALLAIQQIISKGTVQAEELRGQLGERLPGAFQIAARAMGVTTQALGKMLELGQVASDDFLPKFADELSKTFAEEAARAAGSLQGALNSLNTRLLDFKVAIGQGGVASAIIDFAQALGEASKGSDNLAKQLGADLGGALRAFGEAALFAIRHFDTLMSILIGLAAFKIAAFFLTLAAAITSAAKAVLFLNAALLRNPIGLIAGAIALAVASLYEYRDATIQIGDRTTTVGNLVIEIWNRIVSALQPVIAGLLKIAEIVGAVFAELGISAANAAEPFNVLASKLAVVQDQLMQMREMSASLVSAGITPAAEITQEIARLESLQASLVDQLEAAQLAQEHFKEATEATEPAIVAQGEAIKGTVSSLETMLESTRRENEQLTALKAAYEGYGASVEFVTRAIERNNALAAAKISKQQAEESGLTDLLIANQKLRKEIELLEEAEERLAQTRLDAFQAMNDEEMARRVGQASAGGLSGPGLLPSEEELSEPFKNALQSVQAEFTNTFNDISQGVIRSFEDMAGSIHGIFTNMMSNIAALAIFDRAAFAKMSADLGVSPGVLGGAAAATPLIGLASGLFGNQGSQQGLSYGGAAGSAIGGLAGAFFGPAGIAAGAIGGGLLGSVIGSLTGGLLGGGGKQKGKGTLSGGLGDIHRSGRGLNEIADAVNQFDQQIASLLNIRQREAVDAALRQFGSVSVNFKGKLTQDVIDFATGQRAQAAGRGLGFSNVQGVQDIKTALDTRRAIEDLTGAVTAFERQSEELEIQFETLTANAKRFGISLEGLAAAQTKATADLRKSQDAQVAALLSPFEALSAPLEAFGKELSIAGQSPAQQFAAVQEEFQRIAEAARGGSLDAIANLEGAGRALIQLAGQVGASPGAAAATQQVQAVLKDVLGELAESQADAGRGVEDIIARWGREQVDTLKELIEVTREELRRLEKTVRSS